ncbi:hypothetical protein B5S33_g4151 [[Candida] boidinii]|nr:hypothetical protein B5S33_g4151 [[Candida] boidinii]
MTNQSAYREYQQIIRLSLNNSTSTASSSQSSSQSASPNSSALQSSSDFTQSKKKIIINRSKLVCKPESTISTSYSAPLSPESCCASDSDSNNNELSGFSNTTTDDLDSNEQHLKPKITRTKTGCFCCRKRKKKCDELKPICSGCSRNHLTCVYPTEESLKKKSTIPKKKASKITKITKNNNNKSTKKTTTINIKEKKNIAASNTASSSSSSAPAFSKFSALLAIAANESAAVEKEEFANFTSMPNSPVSQACSPKTFKFSNNFSAKNNNNDNNIPSFTSPPQSPPEYISPLSSPNLTPVSFTYNQAIPHRRLSNNDQTHSVAHNYPKSISINSLLN